MKILIAYWQYLEPDKSAGALRLYELTRLIKEAGHSVVFMQPFLRSNRHLAELGVPVCFGIDFARRVPFLFRSFLRWHDFDAAILSPYETYQHLAPLIDKSIPGCALILDTIDLFHIRTRRQAELTGTTEDINNASMTYDAEWRCLKAADSVWVVTGTEQRLIAPSVRRVDVIPCIHRPATAHQSYEEREGIVFLGGFAHSPNVDAVRYFVKEILPLIRAGLPDVPVIIAGSNPPEEFQEYVSAYGVHITGYIPDHRAVLGGGRVGIAPLRYGAGMKGKIGEYLSCGLPCVTTSIGAEGMNFRDGVEVFIADDPVVFADKVIAAYSDRTIWRMLSDNGLNYIQDNLSPAAVWGGVTDALQQVCEEKPRKRNACRTDTRFLAVAKQVISNLAEILRR